MSFKKPSSLKDFLIHLSAVIGVAILLVCIVFYLWLPVSTNHGETITVPDVEGLTYDQLDEFLGKRNLRYEVTKDSSYSPNHPPLTILRQVPLPNSKVKENRKIYVTLNTERPPLVKFPDLIDKSLKAAQMILKSYDLLLGEVSYIPDPVAFGTIHEARINGRVILEGESVAKGSSIDLVAGDGYGNTIFQSPSLVGLDLEEASAAIIGSGLKMGEVRYVTQSKALIKPTDSTKAVTYLEVSPGAIQKQSPTQGIRVKIGDPIDLWVYKPDSIARDAATILDGQ